MTPQFKIRLLLFLLALGFATTAISISLTFNKQEILNLDARQIERNLHSKEEFVNSFLNNPGIFDSLKTIGQNEEWAQQLIPQFSDNHHIYLQTFHNGKLAFWSSNRILLNTDSTLKEGSTFFPWKNGWYEAIKKSAGNFSVICFIPIKANYPYENQYLQNTFSPDLIKDNNLDIATLEDKQAYNIRNSEGKYLFSVKLKSTVTNTFYSTLELWLWVLSVLFGLIFINYLCVWIAESGHVKTAILVLFAGLATFRLVDLEYQWFDNHFDVEIFNPRYYAASYFFPSIGDFLLNVLAITWFLTFIYSYRHKFHPTQKTFSKPASYILFIIFGLIIWVACVLVNEGFYGLITNSRINFDVTNVLNLSWFSWLGIVILCLSALNLYLLIEVILFTGRTLNLNNRERLLIFAGGILALFISRFFYPDFTIYFLLFGLILLLLGWAVYHQKGRLSAGLFLFVLLIFATIASLKLSRFQFLKERESRKILAQKLESSDDPNAVLLFMSLENEIAKDNFIIDYFKNPLANHKVLTNRLQKLYIEGYLSRYEFKSYEFNANGQVLRGDPDVPLAVFRNLALTGSVKVSENFYRVNNTFGFQNYFALLPIKDDKKQIGTLVIELKSKRLNDVASFPELLVDGKIKENGELTDYSYAFYSDGKLLNQQGKYIYNLSNYNFSGKIKDFVFLKNKDYNGDAYSHLIYQPNEQKLIVISKKLNSIFMQLAAASFIFLVLLLFTSLIILIRWMWFGFKDYNISFRNFRWRYLIKTNRMLYKTRIQVSMVAAVVVTLILTGWITFYNIRQQYRAQQEEFILDKVNKISAGFDKTMFRNGILSENEQAELVFNTFAELNGVDLSLFDPQGNLLLSTQPKIYENELVARRMNALAYVYLSQLQKSEYINREQIGRLFFLTAYVPLRDNKNVPIAYLGLPYFSNERDYDERIGLFLNALINVYALVFIAIGFFAVFVANQITNPLTLIQKSLSETKIGRKNEPITWKRNDEIGNLIKEYNSMIAALEESAHKLARSERESAWREMAKQVAHEIKNPLTPLKLGVQLLEKSWRENDPKFDVKFEKFSKSFVEQIESLAHIASEFSNFAKMPDTVFKLVNLQQVIGKSIETYRQMDHVSIRLLDKTGREVFVKADKEQLLRLFNNLFKNAIEAMPEEHAGVIKVLLFTDAKTVFIEIKDNGAGIPESLHERIFAPNFTTKSSGTGLGLAFVKQAIENMDGSIRFVTEQGEGTTFYITIPLAS